MAVVTDRVGQDVAGRYLILAPIGSGGAGEVYQALHLRSSSRVALKTLLPGAGHELAQRFEREAKATALISHPNVVEVLDYGTTHDGALFLVMEFVDGVSLSGALARGPFPPARALRVTVEILRGLGAAHEAGIIHRDLKPSNIMLIEDDRVKILDFGIARLIGDAALDVGGGQLSRTGVIFGTPEYMPPEQALGRKVDGRGDLYAVGVMLFEMLAGRRPFDHEDAMQVLRLQVGAPVPRLADVTGHSHPAALETVVAKALVKERKERFASAAEMAAAVEAALGAL